MDTLFEVHFEIERQCALSCRHCSSANMRTCNTRGYTPHDMAQMLGMLGGYTVIVSLTGGEPLLCEELKSILTIVQSSHPSIKIGLFTTGIVRENQHLAPISVAMANDLSEKGLSFCYVSVYSHLAQIHDKMTHHPGSFSMTREAICRLLQAKVDVRFNTVVYQENQNSLDEILGYAKELSISEVRLLKLVRHGDAMINWNQLMPTLNENEFITLFTRLRKNFGNVIHLSASSIPSVTPCRPVEGAQGCQAGSRILYVSYDGFIYPCACTKNSKNNVICHISDLGKLKQYLDHISNHVRFTCLGDTEER